jgi:midasin
MSKWRRMRTQLKAKGEFSVPFNIMTTWLIHSSAPQDRQGASSADQQEADGPADSAGAPMPASSNDRTDRSLGDILQEIQRRRDEILAQQERDNETTDTNAPEQAPGQVEYLHQGDQDEGLQALGAAGEEERQRLEDLNIVDEEAQEADETANMDDSEEAEPTKVQGREPDASVKTEADAERQAIEKALTQSEVRGDGPDASKSDDELDIDMEDVPATKDVKEEEIDEIEIEVKEGEGVVGTNNDGEDLWRKFSSLTSDLSYALCEQLRLILEPTLATRLQGDFRTGKRLNMRKIIPYIASEYTKDKIWLRRTKPSRREYQVLLSLDDSRSMAESHSVNLAYQTLALVSQALNKLEVGQISIARFGESVDILHPFGDTGFTDADGAKVMDSFKFDQHRTDVAALVERSLSFLAEARQRQASSSSAPDLWQLQVIISDGICQDHQRLRTLLRRALEERVMIVFVIVDSLHRTQATPQAGGASSILSMQTVAYKQVNGTVQLEMERYLDTFPFEFYVVLRDVEALPGVLADTLRQWMTRVSQSNE